MRASFASVTSDCVEVIHADLALIAVIAKRDGARAEHLATIHILGARDRLDASCA